MRLPTTLVETAGVEYSVVDEWKGEQGRLKNEIVNDEIQFYKVHVATSLTLIMSLRFKALLSSLFSMLSAT